nr:RNA-directed DNA polymerase, eukaryota [Tanacetum cinerariifolium]
MHSRFHEAYKLHSPTNSTITPPFTSTNELIYYCNPINTKTHHHQTPLPSNAATIASMDFIIDERVTWVEIDGIPFKMWSVNTFKRIASKWGVVLHVDGQEDGCFHRKRMCIKTKVEINIFESFKIIFHGRRFKKRRCGLKELFYFGEDSDVEEVPKTKLEEVLHKSNMKEASVGQMDMHSEDPFKIYDLLNKKQEDINKGPSLENSLKYPPGFTPTDDTEEQGKKNDESKKESVEDTWNEALVEESNAVINMIKKLKYLKQKIREWNNDKKKCVKNSKTSFKEELADLDKVIDKGEGNAERNQLTMRGVLAEGTWIDDPLPVKREFLDHFKTRFYKPDEPRIHLNMHFPNTLSSDQQAELEIDVSKEEIKRAVIKNDVVAAVTYFFHHGIFPKGSNSSFIALILKIPDANMVKDFRPISLIGSLYKIIAKILANQLVAVLGDIVNEVQSAFVADRQILEGPFILNELFQWCKLKKKQSLIFKVYFEKAYNSVRCDFLDDILKKFGFEERWCGWIQSCLTSRVLIIVNESLHISFQRVVDACMFKGIPLGPSLQLSYMFYADDAVFVGDWSDANIDTIVHVKLMGIYVEEDKVDLAASKIGCLILKTPFSYLGCYIAWNPFAIIFNGNGPHGNKPSWVKWKNVLASKKKGCLGVSSLYALNRGLMLKWVWRFITQSTSLWARVIKAIHGDDGKMGKNAKSAYQSIWLDIVHEMDLLKKQECALESCKSVDVSSKLSHLRLDSSFRRVPRGGDFSVASVRKLIDNKMLSKVAVKTRWIKVVPIKVNVHAWKVSLDFLPTRLNISRRGMDIDSIICPMCDNAVESTSHLFFTCHIAREIFRKISRWWDVSYMDIYSYEEWVTWIVNLRLSMKYKKVLEGVYYVMWWHIWAFRNKRIFGLKNTSMTMIFDDVVSRSFYWCRCGCVVLLVDDQEDGCFHRKRMRIKTLVEINIFESFKIIFHGNVFWIRAKEVSGWAPDFMEDNEEEYDIDCDTKEEDSKGEDAGLKSCSIFGEDSDVEEVPETKLEEVLHKSNMEEAFVGQMDMRSEDPFKIYDLLNKKQEDINKGPSLENSLKTKMLWDYLAFVIDNWKGEVVIMCDFNEGFDKLVEDTWNEAPMEESNAVINMMKKLKYLKQKIREWNNDKKKRVKNSKTSIKEELADLDMVIDKGEGNAEPYLECFYRASGMRISMNKRKLMGISVEEDKVDLGASKIGCLILKTLFSYLGLKVGGIMSRKQSWNEVVDRVIARLSKWNEDTLNWRKVKASQVAIHGDDGKMGKNVKSAYQSIWLLHEMDLLKKQGIDVANCIKIKFGNRVNTSFWEDVWRGDIALKHLYPRMCALESCKSVDVSSKLSHLRLDSSFHRVPRGGAEQDQFIALKT